MAFKNKKKQKLRHSGTFEKLDKLREATFLFEGGQFHEALEFLEDATQKYPSDLVFWEMLAAAGTKLRDVPAMQKSFAKLTRFQPNDSQYWFGLAFAYILDARLALAYRGFREFFKKFPGDEKSEEAAEMMKMAEEDLWRNLSGFDFPDGDEGVELACLHEEAQILMSRHQFEEAREMIDQLIRQKPDFVPAYNNLSLTYFMDGKPEEAVETAQKVLVKEPDNFHALANLVRFAVFLGNREMAREFADRLRSVESDNPDIWVKKIEAFTFAGDDKSVVEVFNESNRKTNIAVPENFGKHLAAFAFYRLGKEKEARTLWQAILKDDPNFDFAKENLDELNLPENERNVFALPISYWIPVRYINELMAETGKLKDGKHFEKNLSKKLGQFFLRNPNIVSVLSVLLERGDESGREFAIKLMSLADTPEPLAVLRDFAFSKNGSDKIRYQAATALSQANAISNKVRLWSNGEWREMMLMTFEVTGEPIDNYKLKPKAQQMVSKGFGAMQRKSLDLAAEYFDMARQANGEDHPTILYNLLVVEQMRGNHEGTETKLRELVRRFPEYSFAAITLATMEVKKGNLKAAKKLTERLYEKKKWNFGEMTPWFYFNLKLALKEKNFDSARMSLEMLRKFDDDLDHEYWDDLISNLEAADKISRTSSKSPRRKNRF